MTASFGVPSARGDEVLAARLGKLGALAVFCDEHCAEGAPPGSLLERVPCDTNACLHCFACGFLISWPRGGCSLHDHGCPEVLFEMTTTAVEAVRHWLPEGVEGAYAPWPLLALAADLWYHDPTLAPRELARAASKEWLRLHPRPPR